MQISIEQPGVESLGAVQQAINSGGLIRRSPHVGNMIADDLNLLYGLSEMGATVEVELVDSIKGSDNFSDPRRIKTNQGNFTLASLKQVKSRVVGACVVGEVTPLPRLANGQPISPGDSLLELHVASLQSVLPEGIQAQVSSQLYRGLGQEATMVLLAKSAEAISRPLRYVDSQGKAYEISPDSPVEGIFGYDPQPLQGALVPLEAMIAAEAILAARNNDGENTTITHIGGNDMARYTADPAVIETVSAIAGKTCAELGILASTTVTYAVPTRPELLADPLFPQPLQGIEITSQYDMIGLEE